MDDSKALILVKSYLKDVHYKEPERAQNLNNRTVKAIKNAFDKAILDKRGWIWIEEESIHSLLRVKTKADARYYLQSVPKEYEISINGKQYIRGFVFISFINKFMEEKGNNKYLPLVLANTGVSHNYNKKVVGLEQSLTKKRSTCRETLTRKRYPVSRRYFFFSYETFFQFQLLSLLYDLPWTLLSTFAASYTFFSVDKGNVILYGYCSKFTLFHTDSTADTSHFTNGHNFFSFVL